MKHLLLCIASFLSLPLVHAQVPFASVEEQSLPTTLILSPGLDYRILFRQGESMILRGDGRSAPARGEHDFTAYMPIEGSSDHGVLIVSHEVSDSNSFFGDGGSMTSFEIRNSGGRWQALNRYHHIDFASLGLTWENCGGGQTPHGTALTAEEFPPASNKEMHRNGDRYRDTGDVTIRFDGTTRRIQRWQNMGWMVEVAQPKPDAAPTEAVHKLFKMGRFSHESAVCMEDGRTVYLTDDFDPSVFFKFVSARTGDYTDGQLYAYRQSDDGMSGGWIPLPMELDSLIDARGSAIRRGATLFVRHEWATGLGGKIYIAETGKEQIRWGRPVALGGRPAYHHRERLNSADTTLSDFYGRVLEFDPATGRMRVLIEGGAGRSNPRKHLSNPDCLTSTYLGGRGYLVICENTIALTRGRVSPEAEKAQQEISEIFWLDLGVSDPTVDDLVRFGVGPAGAEMTGARFTPDGKTLFLNIQHPSPNNPAPFNMSMTVAVTGYAR